MSDPVDDLMDKMARNIAPIDQNRQEALLAAWRVRRNAARGYDPKVDAEHLRRLIEATDDEAGHA
jgi:hypothetical protein